MNTNLNPTAPIRAAFDEAAAVLRLSGGGPGGLVLTVHSTCPELHARIRIAEIGEGIESVGYRAFFDCRALEEIRLPDSLRFIGEKAFQNCAALRAVSVPAGVQEIGIGAFHGCAELEEIALPAALRRIRAFAFRGCDALRTVRYAGTKAQWEAIRIEDGCEPLTGAEIIFES